MITLRPYQQKLVADIYECIRKGKRKIIVQMVTGSGKCLGIGTPVLMYDGSTRAVEDIRPGEVIMGPDSRPRIVSGVTTGESELFRIVPIKGQPWVCNRDHILTLVHTTTGQIVDVSVDSYLRQTNEFKHCFKLFFPEQGINFPTIPEPKLDPYFFGVWMGDGTKALKGIQISKPDDEIWNLCQEIAIRYCVNARRTIYSGKCPTIALTTPLGKPNPLLNLLRKTVDGDVTRIPKSFLVGSEKTRRAFLAGMLDTDGYLHNSCFEIVQKHKGVSEGICFIARSLGIRSLMCEKKVNGDSYWRVSLSGDFTQLPLRIKRKISQPRLQKKRVNRSGFSLESLGIGKYAGFELDQDGRFLLGDFTVTHNTATGSHLANAEVDFGGSALWIAAREELVMQAYRTLDDGRNRVGVIMANPPMGAAVNPNRPIQVASLQTLQARKLTPHASLVIADEAKHLTDSNTWGSVLDPYKASVIIGLDATPVNGSGAALKDFEAMVHGPSVKELIALGVLVEPEIIYPGRQLAPKTIAQKPLDAYVAHANGKQCMVFAQNSVAAKEYAAEFKAAGIACEFVSYETPDRGPIMDRFKSGKLQVLINQNLFVEGFDHAALDTIILARRCGTDEIYVQICGRVLRAAPGKTRALIVDLTGNVFAFGSPVDERIYTLGGTSVIKPGGKPDFRFCITCGAVLTQPLGSICDDCAALGVTAAQMQAPTITGDKLRRFAGINKRPENDRKEHYFRMMRELENKSKDIRGAFYKYKAIYTKPDGSPEEPPYKWITEYRTSPQRYMKS